MNKIPRYMKEYANSKKRDIESNDLIKLEIKTKGIESINKILKAYECGSITVDEAMENIIHCFN